MEQSLKWSSKLQVVADTNKRLHGDKITLPPSALEALLAAAPIVSIGDHNLSRYTPQFDPFNQYSFAEERLAREVLSDRQQQLPHPLTFRLVNPVNGRVVYAGIREFSAEEGTVVVSSFLQQALGLEGTGGSQQISREGTPSGNAMEVDRSEVKGQAITVHAHQLSKGTYVRLRPLEAGYDPEDWKSLLERHLRDNFTTLTNGEILDVSGVRHEQFRFLIDQFQPEGDGICVVDTDLEVDIEALNEEQARETLNRKLAKSKRAPGTIDGSSTGGPISVDYSINGQVLPGEYVDYELKEWDRTKDVAVVVEAEEGTGVELLGNPFSSRQRIWPRIDEHIWSDLSCRPVKRIILYHSNQLVAEAETIRISVYSINQAASNLPIPFSFAISYSSTADEQPEASDEPGPDEVRCKNCSQIVPKTTLPLHEAFCYRNNVVCPKCKNVFLKNSEIWKTHWHCPHDHEYGNGEAFRTKHDIIFHPETPYKCPGCGVEGGFVYMTLHRTTDCPAKEILCQFCHLVVPQQGPDDPPFWDAEVQFSNLTPHEVSEGSRTTECHLCGKIVKLQNMNTHLRLHDRDRILKPKPKLCVNLICGRVIKSGKEIQADKEHLGLCDECYGPLHGTAYDPEGKALRRRIERRLLQQLMGGCGKIWCHNRDWCRTGKKNSTGEDIIMSTKDALPVVKPVLDLLVQGDSSKLKFCTDESAQIRRSMAEMMAAESVYELEWCARALEESKNDVGKARDWLKEQAPKKDEVIR